MNNTWEVLTEYLGAGGSLLGGFLELVVRRLLLEDLGKDTLEMAADALFPLILSHTSAFQSLGEYSNCQPC